MGEKSEIRVKFEIGEIKFEAEGSAELVERERSIFNNTLLPAAIDAIVRTRSVTQSTQYIGAQDAQQSTILTTTNAAALPEQAVVNSTMDFSRMSLASFAKSKGADAHYDFIICAAYFNEKRNGISSFSSATLKELYSEAKKPLPNNLSMSLSELVKKGLIMEDISSKGTTPKMYVLTLEGEESIKNMHPTEAKEKKTVSKPRKQRQKGDSPYSTINCDDLNLDQYTEVRLLKDFKEKMMLILYIVTNEGKGEWFTTADVLCLMTDIFGEAATNKQVDGVFRREKRWFKSENIDGNNKLVHRKLLNEGKSYAQSLGVATE
jgi:DNA-binding HxlR family transcriptional regulator